jgi:alkylation response protein AidB-like acyl-CoA dehydrogenase
VDFDLSEEQQLLRDVTRDVLSRNYDVTRYNEIINGDLGWSREVWDQLAEVGLLGLGFDPTEAGQIEIMVVMTEIGRRLAPEPVAQAALIPGGLVAEVGTDEQKKILDDVSAGTALLAFAHDEPGAHVTTGELETRAERSGDTWTVSGRKNPVLAGDWWMGRQRPGIRTAPSTAGGGLKSTSTPYLPSRWAADVTRENISRAP